MKYYRMLDPGDLTPEDEKKSVYIGWKEILNPRIENGEEEDIEFLHCMLINLPVLEDNGKIVEKTVLLARLTDEDDYEMSTIQVKVTEELCICYDI